MRLQIYVPQRAADAWEPEAGFITWQEFQRRAAKDAGSIAVMAANRLHDHGRHEAVFIVEAIVPVPVPGNVGWTEVHRTWAAFTDYARQLRDRGYSVLLVNDGQRMNF